jgi:hypothetical protein
MPSIFEKLNFTDVGVGAVQAVDEMMVIPIIGSDRGNIAEPQALKFQSTRGYGNMVFKNEDTEKPAIVPTNLMVRGKYAAQDHAMSEAGIVSRNETMTFDTACCIEQTQGGYLTDKGENVQDILPIELRKALLTKEKRQEKSYGKLWSSISSWLKGLSISGKTGTAAHLNYFYSSKEIADSLEQFASEFEPVEGQIGAIILFNGIPVGIEIMPTNAHWQAYWKYLIRGCYGAELLRLKMLNKIPNSTLILPEIPKESDAEKVKEILSNFCDHVQKDVLPLLESIDVLSQTQMTNKSGLTCRLVKTKNGGGDLISEGTTPIYLSIVV